jgi:Sulfotransferase family
MGQKGLAFAAFSGLVVIQGIIVSSSATGTFIRLERIMAYWAKVLPLRVFDLRYEELTADQEAITQQLVAFCGLDWDDRCLRFQDTKRLVRTTGIPQV